MNQKNNESRNDSDQMDAARCSEAASHMTFIADLQDALKVTVKDYRVAENDVQIQTKANRQARCAGKCRKWLLPAEAGPQSCQNGHIFRCHRQPYVGFSGEVNLRP